MHGKVIKPRFSNVPWKWPWYTIWEPQALYTSCCQHASEWTICL